MTLLEIVEAPSRFCLRNRRIVGEAKFSGKTLERRQREIFGKIGLNKKKEQSGLQKPTTQTLSLIRRLLGLAWRYRLGCLLSVARQMTLVCLSLVSLRITGLAIDVLRWRGDASRPTPEFPFGWAPSAETSMLSLVIGLAGLVCGLATLHAGLRFYASKRDSRLIERLVANLRAEVYAKLQRLSFRFYDANTSSSIINRVAGDVQAVRQFIDGVVLQVLIVTLSLIVYLWHMLHIHAWLTLACLATTPLLWVGAVLFSRTTRPAYLEHAKLVDRLILTFSENIQGQSVVKGCVAEEQQNGLFADDNRAVLRQKHDIFWRLSLFQPAMGLLTQVNMVVLLGYGGHLAISGQVAVGTGLFVFANLLQQIANQIGQVTNIANSIQTSLAGAERVFEVLDAPEELVRASDQLHLSKDCAPIRFENVSFAYHEDSSVLRDVSFTICPGEMVALVGPVGAGKSTLLGLLPRFYDPRAGRITIGGVDLRSLDLDELRQRMGVVFQESFLFSHTVAANIAYGRPDVDFTQIRAAARQSAADDFLSALPQQYETIVGESGNNLSGGQRQRLALARALLVEPEILILDDAMSAVDPGTESKILDSLMQNRGKRTTLIATHRLGVLQRADKILVLEEGLITQMGSCDELSRQKGFFRKFLQAQTLEESAPRRVREAV